MELDPVHGRDVELPKEVLVDAVALEKKREHG